MFSTPRDLACALTLLAIAAGAHAAPAAESTTAKPAAQHKKYRPAAKPMLRTDYSAITDMAGGLAKSVAVSAIMEVLFPTKTIDPEKLLADITENMRKELIAMVTDNDGTALTAATTALLEYELMFKRGDDGIKLEALIATSSTLNGVDTVLARTGPDGQAKYVDFGLPLYVAAAQIKANRLELQRKMVPGRDAALRAVLVSHLESSLAHARNIMTKRRLLAMGERLDAITECYVTSHDMHGFGTTTYKTSFNDAKGPQGQRMPRSQADNDESKALARCEGQRDPYYDKVRRAIAPGVDQQWLQTNAILDLWAQTLDTLKGPSVPSARVLAIDFGGMFGIGERQFANPLNGGAVGCPAGYNAYEFKGTTNVDWPASYCGKPGGDTETLADFGGMFGKSDHADNVYWNNNPLTGKAECPAGFTKSSANNQQELNYCWRAHVAAKPADYLFGGLYSDNGDKKNPITDAMICPVGYLPALVHGTRASSGIAATRRTVLCYAKRPAKKA